MKRYLIMILTTTQLSSCIGPTRAVLQTYKHELYIDYKFVSFQGRNSQQSIYLSIDSTMGIWFTGKLVINKTDTILIKGFEKGNHYVTTYFNKQNNATSRLAIWSFGESYQIVDSLTIEDLADNNKIVSIKTKLFRGHKNM